MAMSKKWLIIGFLYGALIFLLSPSFQAMVNNPGFWNIKEQLLYLTGSIAMVYMVICMVLSIRLESVNKLVGGLDKAYVIHKWAGIFALVFSILHWLVKEGPRFLGMIMTLPPKIRPGGGGASQAVDIQKLIYDFGNNMVEVAFYIILVVLVISLLKRVPYNIFRLVHKIIPVLFLIIVFHGATIQLKGKWYWSIGSVLLWVTLIAGSIAAVICLLQKIGQNRKVKATVTKVTYYQDAKVLDLRLSLSGGNFSWETGQYVFLKFPFCREPHPFSIASYDKNMQEVGFLIKELGDFTKKLGNNIKEGDTVILEGAYGKFTFDDKAEGQIWVAGGIGVAPFVSRLEYLAANGGSRQPIDFFYSARGESFLKPILSQLCEKAGVNFHYTNTLKEERLNMDKIKEKVKNISGTSLWYCGPVQFCHYLKKALQAHGLKNKLHYDNFDMR